MKKSKFTNYDLVYDFLKKGKTIIIATDTVYGLVSCKKENLYRIKNRSLKKN